MRPEYRQLTEETGRLLGAVNQEASENFLISAEQLEWRLSVDEYREFTASCLGIANAGWRAHESLKQLLAISLQLSNGPQITRAAHVAESLTGYSFEPSSKYLDAVLVMMRMHVMDRLPELEQIGLSMQACFPHASGLISSFFRAAASVLVARGGDEFSRWLKVSGALPEQDRESILEFLKVTEANADISWSQVEQVAIQNRESVNSYLQACVLLRSHFNEYSWLLVNDLLTRFSVGSGDGLGESLRTLTALDPKSQQLILSLASEVENIDVAEAFISSHTRLPLDRAGVLEHWFRTGLEQEAENQPALCAWMRVESKRSVELLENLRGQVRLEDSRRVLDLLAESVAGRSVKIESPEGRPDYRSGSDSLDQLPGIDGQHVTLPAWVNIFDDAEDNFGFYKVSLFHQLGFREFGCFDAIDRVVTELDSFTDSKLAEQIFLIVENARIDWQLAIRFQGLRVQLGRQKQQAVLERPGKKAAPLSQLLEVLVRCSLDAPYEKVVDETRWPEAAILWQAMESLKVEAGTDQALDVTRRCYEVLEQVLREQSELTHMERQMLLAEMPEPIRFRGELELSEVQTTMQIEAILEAVEEEIESGEENPLLAISAMPDPDQLEIGEIIDGEVSEGVQADIEALENRLNELKSQSEDEGARSLPELLSGIAKRSAEASLHKYDEWDYQIGDYRARWCSLFEHRDMPIDREYFSDALLEHSDLSRKIRQELNKVKPEMLRKIRGVSEGEELDLERSITYLIDKRAGLTPDENIYVERQRRDRDVSTMFLLDMSASTDDIIPDPDAEPIAVPDVDDDEYLMEFFEKKRAMEADARRIIDLEKESVILMADALESLGDSYSVCGFSGYGKDQVDYYLCKDFDESLSDAAKSRIGGIRACRSTRMGPPIRHATRRLIATGSRIKALIIISDGYPQDHDYGTDRNSREYGLLDTMKALSEAHQQGVTTYCLTVDPSGHDYLRAMCPDSQYMVIQDIVQLPEELSRVYRSLTS